MIMQSNEAVQIMKYGFRLEQIAGLAKTRSRVALGASSRARLHSSALPEASVMRVEDTPQNE